MNPHPKMLQAAWGPQPGLRVGEVRGPRVIACCHMSTKLDKIFVSGMETIARQECCLCADCESDIRIFSSSQKLKKFAAWGTREKLMHSGLHK